MPAPLTKCPICKHVLVGEESLKYLPFCSKKCQDKDLGNWVFENYKAASSDRVVLEDDEE